MVTYEEIKTWLANNREKIVLGVCFVLVFVVGFGTGRFEREIRRNSYKPQNNYTTATTKKPTPTTAPAVAEQGIVAGASTTPPSTCIIKGNISAAGKKIYHVQGGAFYKIVKPEQCFNTEAEALAEGFVKSGR